jgi:hypothetical protein
MRRLRAPFGDYCADDSGNIWSHKSGHLKKLQACSGTRRGYLNVTLCCNDGCKHTFQVHRIILETFVGPRPDGMQCRHLNGNASDNRLENLTWGTPQENSQDAARHGTAPKGERNGSSKLTTDQVQEIRQRLAVGENSSALGRGFGVTHKAISFIKHKRNWAWLT